MENDYTHDPYLAGDPMNSYYDRHRVQLAPACLLAFGLLLVLAWAIHKI